MGRESYGNRVTITWRRVTDNPLTQRESLASEMLQADKHIRVEIELLESYVKRKFHA